MTQSLTIRVLQMHSLQFVIPRLPEELLPVERRAQDALSLPEWGKCECIPSWAGVKYLRETRNGELL